jgi:hypothetical protein
MGFYPLFQFEYKEVAHTQIVYETRVSLDGFLRGGRLHQVFHYKPCVNDRPKVACQRPVEVDRIVLRIRGPGSLKPALVKVVVDSPIQLCPF